MANKKTRVKQKPVVSTSAASAAGRKYPKKSIRNIPASMTPTVTECRTVASAAVLVINGGAVMPTA